jgi:hypothetical protein
VSNQDITEPNQIKKLLSQKIEVINLGLERFAENFSEQGIPYIQVDWRPPAGGDTDISDMLAALRGI